MSGWNFADVWEIVAERSARRPCPDPGRPTSSRGASSTAGPTASPQRCSTPGVERSRTRSPSTSTTAPSTSSRCSPRSRPALVPVNTNYRYADDELVYLWDNADAGRRGLPRHVRRHASSASATGCPKVRTLALGRRRHAARAPTGPIAYEDGGRRRRTERVVAAVGPRAATTSTCSTPAAPPACRRA